MTKPGLLTAGLIAAGLAGGIAHASGGGGEGGGGVNLVPMEPVTVPIVESDRLEGAMTVKLVIDAKDEATAARLGARGAELRSATIAAALEFARLEASGFRPVNVEKLDHDLFAALHAFEPGIARVLIVEVSAKRG